MSEDDKSLWDLLAFSDHDSRSRLMANVVAISLAWQIRGMRNSRSWSQSELAERMGVHYVTVSRLEDPEHVLHTSMTTLLAVATAFDTALVARFADWKEWMEQMLGQNAFVPSAFNEETIQQTPGA